MTGRILAAAALLSLATPARAEPPTVTPPATLPAQFDEFGPAVQSLTLPSGRVVHYTDTAEPGFRPVLFIGGTGTSARAAGMTDFMKTLRKAMKLRFIVVERNGFGDTAYKPDWTYADYAGEVRAVLDTLAVKRFAGIAISGGGPYLGAVAAAMPDRVISLHLLATAATMPSNPGCKLPLPDLAKAMADKVQNPQVWWGFPPTSPTFRIPGFSDRAYEEGARTFYIRGQMGDPTPEAAEMQRYCGAAPDVSKVTAPVTIYQGGNDQSVKMDQAEYWKAHYPNATELRVYPGEGHDVQYRHWDQVLVEVAGITDRTVVCAGGVSKLAPKAKVPAGATFGICAWAKP